MLFVEYPKCSTCRKAKKWLDEHDIEYEDRDIVKDNPQFKLPHPIEDVDL